MGNKRMSKLQGMALVAAMVASMSSVGYADVYTDNDTLSNDSSLYIDENLEVYDDLYVEDNTVIDGSLLVGGTGEFNDTLYVRPVSSGPGVPVPGDLGAPDDYFTYVAGGILHSVAVQINDETQTLESVVDGGAMIETNGDVTLRDGSVTTSTTYTDYANITKICVDPLGCSGTLADGVTPFSVVYNEFIETYAPGGTGEGQAVFVEGELVDFDFGATFTDPGTPVITEGGNLDMSGNLIVGGTANMTGGLINNLAAGVALTDAANVGQVNAAVLVETNARIADVDAEESARIAADDTLQDNIDAEEDARILADDTLQDNIDAEEDARILADDGLQNNIDDEASARIAADNDLQDDIDDEVAIRSSLIHMEDDGIHIGEDSLVYAENHFDDGGDRLFTTDGDGIAVTETFSVKPAQVTAADPVIDEDDDGTLPGITNDDDTSTVYTQTGSVTQTTSYSSGGGVTMETNGDVTLSKADIGGTEARYLQVTTFLVDNETGLPMAGTEEQVGGYLNEEGDFVVLGDLDGDGLLNLDALTSAQLAAITTTTAASSDGANLTVEGMTTTNGINNSGAKITGVAAGTAATDAVNKGQLDTVNTAVTTEVANRIADVNAEESARIAADNTLTTNLNAEIALRTAAVNSEASARIAGDAALNNRVDSVEERLDQVGAFSAAFSALVPNDRVSGNTQLSLGYGYYASESALAAGLFHYVNNNVLLNVGASTSLNGGETAGRAGVTIGF